MSEAAADRKKIILVSDLDGVAHTTMNVSVQMLKNILQSFISNAIDYSTPGSPVMIGVKEEGKAIIFSVKDTGIGIPTMEHSKIFDRFYRAPNARSVKAEGTGLGLYMANVIAEKLVAKIRFESEDDKGSSF